MNLFQILVVTPPGPYAQTFFNIWKKSGNILLIFFVFVYIGPHGSENSKRYYSYKSQPKVFKLFLNFLPNGPHKNYVWDFDILKLFYSVSLTWDSMGEKISNVTPPTNRSQTFWNWSWNFLPMASQNYFWDFESLSFWSLTIFFRKFQINHCSLWRNIQNLNYL